ncbi:hypothetical protein HYZ64_01645 [Candidatus Berkelbacteria bacterium]|nr:hypothetical protein [Candidatus Berkelbacteria bacterium]
MRNQRTSLVSDGLGRQIGRMVEDAVRNYSGGTSKAELAKGHPAFGERFHDLLDALASERAQTLAITERPVWKTVRIGTHESVQALRQAVLNAGCKMGQWTNNNLNRITVALTPTDLDLYLVSEADLGYPRGAPRAQIYAAADRYGFAPCPAEIGLQLRKQYLDQPKEEVVLVAMEQIEDSHGHLAVFYLEHGLCGLVLDGYFGRPYYFPGVELQWVFCRK